MTGSTYAPQTWNDVQASNVKPNIVGITGTCTANSTHNIDTLIADDSLIKSIEFFTNSAIFGDTITVSIIDKDAVYFPANTVVSTPVLDYNILPTGSQSSYHSVAPFKILGGLYIRISYTSTGLLNTVSLGINFLFLKCLI